MKKLIFIATILIAVIITIGLISCAKTNITENNNETTELVNPYNYMGETHNEGLDYILEGIQNLSNSGVNASFDEFSIQVSNSYNEFCVNNIEGYDGISISYKCNFAEMSSVFLNSRGTLLDSIIANSELSEKQKEYLEKIPALFVDFDEYTELSDSLNTLSSLVQADTELSEEEKLITLGSYSVALSSYEYWVSNFDEWINVINTALDLELDANDFTEDEIRNIALSDVAGGLGGGIGGAIWGALVGPAGAGAGAVIGGGSGLVTGAIGGSVTCAIIMWLQAEGYW